jgi:hypothetical protein
MAEVRTVTDDPAGDGGDAVRLGAPGRRVRVGADIGLEGDVADGDLYSRTRQSETTTD